MKIGRRIEIILIVLVFSFGALYVSWQFGRKHQRDSSQVVKITRCVIQGGKEECELTEIDADIYRKLQKALIEELSNPKGKQYWQGKYQERNELSL